MAWRGEDVSDQLTELETLGKTSDDILLVATAIDTEAYVAMAAGRLSEAADAFREEGEIVVDQQAMTLYPAARPALWLGDRERAAADLAHLDATGVHGPVVECRRATIRAGLLALDGRTAEAVVLYRDVLARWESLGLAVDRAMTAIDMATLVGPGEADVVTAAADAREMLRRVGATPFLERLEAAIAAPRDRSSTAVPAVPSDIATAAGTGRG